MLAALRIRRDAGIGLTSPLNIHDVAERHGVEVWLSPISSLEGFYCSSPGPMIILNSLRPEGRKAYTCAHEFGHHVFGHGTKADTQGVGLYSNNKEEFLVDCFAGFLLMPRAAVCHAFLVRGWNYRMPTPQQVYAIACLFGVGYTTLIHHMRASITLLDEKSADDLEKVRIQIIQSDLGGRTGSSVIPVDENWVGRPVDITVGDRLLVPDQIQAEATCLFGPVEGTRGRFFEAKRPGVGRLRSHKGEWSAFVRVSRREYMGKSAYRFMEDPDAE